MSSPQKVVAVAYERLSLQEVPALTGKNWVLWIGGRLRAAVAHEGSTAADIYMARVSFRHSALSGNLSNNNHHQSEVLVSIVHAMFIPQNL